MKNTILFLFLTLSILYSPETFARRTRSDKGGHHNTHHSSSSSSSNTETSETTVVEEEKKEDPIKNQSPIPGLIIIACIVGFVYYRKRKKKKKLEEERQLAIQQYHSEINSEGRVVYEKLQDMYETNQSMKDFSQFEGLEGISTLNELYERFEVKSETIQDNIQDYVINLTSRYDAEYGELEGMGEKEVESEFALNIQENEILYRVFRNCSWHELKKVRVSNSFNYGGLGLRIPLGKGLSYRMGRMTVSPPQYKEELVKLCSGTLYVTNNRLIFIGGNENKTIKLNSIMEIELFKDSVTIGKTTGKKPTIYFSFDDAPIFSRVLFRLY